MDAILPFVAKREQVYEHERERERERMNKETKKDMQRSSH